jgi:hypothetical protein
MTMIVIALPFYSILDYYSVFFFLAEAGMCSLVDVLFSSEPLFNPAS